MSVSVSGGITGQGSIARQLQEGINAVTNTEYKDYDPEYAKILDVFNSKKAYEEDVPFAATGLAKQKPEGQGIEYDSMQEGSARRYNHIVYALGLIITEEAIEDNLYMNLIDKGGRSLKRSLVHTKEQVAANVFNNGYTSSLAWDGKPVFAADHVSIKGGAFSNVLATPADLSEASLEDAIIAIEDFRDDAGLLINAKVKTLHIPRQLRFVAERILGSNLQNDTANNAINALKSLSSVPGGYHVNHRFTDPDNWFLRTDVMDGGKLFNRSADRFQQDNDFGTSNYRHKGTTRFSVGVTDARQYFGSGQVS
jgi:hypothetical protein